MSEPFETAARTHGIALFEERLILQSQPPITEAAVAKIQSRCVGPIPEGMLALWRVSFGGALDYDLSIQFGEHIAPFSFTELFYPDSDGYRDLWGWIEEELAEQAAHDVGKPPCGRLGYLPFGGFEHLCRLYVCVQPGPNYGAVFAWTQGMPPGWTLSLHGDAVARVTDDVPSLFRQLDLEQDPFAADEDSEVSGHWMAETISDVRVGDPALADSLAKMVRDAVLDWRAALEAGDIASRARLRRVALEQAATAGDVALMIRLATAGCDLDELLRGGGSMLDHALVQGRIDAAAWLIGQGVDVSRAVTNGASQASPEMIRDLLERGAVHLGRQEGLHTVAGEAALGGRRERLTFVVHLGPGGAEKTRPGGAHRKAVSSCGSGANTSSVRFSNRVYSGRKATSKAPTGPLRCFAMMISALFCKAGSSLLYCPSR